MHVTLLTDFGTADYYVAAVKGTLLRLAPGVALVDLSHEIPPGDLEAAADLLAGAAPTFPAGTVHLAVVDPGVGTDRRILVAEAGGQRFVAPDNGLLEPFLEEALANGRIWSVERDEHFLDAPGSTFHGRDRFAPVAAAIARSARVVHSTRPSGRPGATEMGRMGRRIDDPVRLDRPAPSRHEGSEGREGTVLTGRVARVDRFGNLVTDLPADWLGGERPPVEVAGHRTSRWVTCYAELPAAEGGSEPAAGALIGSRGTVELSLRNADLAARWEVGRGAPVRIVLG
jgi:S-adenosyl-L-methionine hydrolase (adenosine-forming)